MTRTLWQKKNLFTTSFLSEHALKSRPLSSLSGTLCDLNFLTPRHCLLGDYSTYSTVIPSLVDIDKCKNCKPYARAQSYTSAIWFRCIREYLPMPNWHTKQHTPGDQHFKNGELDRFGLSRKRTLGFTAVPVRIEELLYCSVSIERSAVLLTLTGSRVHPLVKLVPVFATSWFI